MLIYTFAVAFPCRIATLLLDRQGLLRHREGGPFTGNLPNELACERRRRFDARAVSAERD
jgi:hypothetical protein